MRQDFYEEYFRIEDRHWWFVGRRKILLDMLARELGPGGVSGRRILDVGCGTGTMLGYLDAFGNAQGIDGEEEAVAFCRRRGLTRVICSQLPPLPYEDGQFDVVTALDFLEHVGEADQMLTELRRVTTPGGWLMVTVPAYEFLWGDQDEIAHHHRRYTARRLRRELDRAGLSVQRLSYFNSILFPAIAAIRIARRLVPRPGPARSDFEMTEEGGLANRLLGRLFALESKVLARTDIPFGVSLVALARVPDRPHHGRELAQAGGHRYR